MDWSDSTLVSDIATSDIIKLVDYDGDTTAVDIRTSGRIVISTDTFYLMSIFSNIEYADTLFTRKENNTLTELMWFSSATDSNDYFNVPQIATVGNRITVKKSGGDQTTVAAAITAASEGDSIYISSGVFNENGVFSALYTTKEIDFFGVGNTTLQSVSTGRLMYIDSGTKTNRMYNLVLDGESATTSIIESQSGNSNLYVNECAIINSNSVGVRIESGDDNTFITNVAFIGNENTCISGLATFDVDGCYFSGDNDFDITFSTSTATVTNTRSVSSPTASIYLSSGTNNVIVTNCLFENDSNTTSIITAANSGTNIGTIIIDSSTFNIDKTSSPAISIVNDSDYKVTILNCSINVSNIHNGGVIFIENQDSATITGNYINMLQPNNAAAIKITTDKVIYAGGYKVNNNLINTYYEGGYGIFIGEETSGLWDNQLEGGEIIGNLIFGGYHFYDTLITTISTHAIMVSQQDTFTIANNYINKSGIGIIIKSPSSNLPDNVINNNIVYECRRGVWFNSGSGLKFYNNTVINDNNSYCVRIIEGANGFSSNLDFRNNIFYAASSTATLEFDGADTAGYIGFNNIHYINNGNPIKIGVSTFTLSAWKILSYDVGSISSEPGLRSLTSPFPVYGSKAIKSGISISGFNDRIKYSSVWTDNITTQSGITIGAYDFKPYKLRSIGGKRVGGFGNFIIF